MYEVDSSQVCSLLLCHSLEAVASFTMILDLLLCFWTAGLTGDSICHYGDVVD